MTSLFVRAMTALKDRQEGATMVEYGLLAALIAVFLITILTTLGGALEGLFQSVVDEL